MPASPIRSVAVIGAGASGNNTSPHLTLKDSQLMAEQEPLRPQHSMRNRDSIEYRFTNDENAQEAYGWICDPDPGSTLPPPPGHLPPDTDPPLKIPSVLPATTKPTTQDRHETTPTYLELTTNVPAIAMSFSDRPFPYGPFVPHWVSKECIQGYFSQHRTDSFVAFGTTLECLTKLPRERWSLTLRRHDPSQNVDYWWKDEFDAVVLCNGHYSVPYIPFVPGLVEYIQRYPGKVTHSKTYRSVSKFTGKKVLIIGNSASGHDITTALRTSAKLPVYQSRRSRAMFDGDEPPPGVEWKPIITSYCASTATIKFADRSVLRDSDVDHIIYCTGYNPSYPFWDAEANGGPLWSYRSRRLVGSYLHTFFRDQPTLGIVGMPRTLTFRSFEYQAIALSRVWSLRNSFPLPDKSAMKRWEDERASRVEREGKKFHDIPWDDGETVGYLTQLYDIAGLPTLEGNGRSPPILDAETRWQLEHVKKYPIHGDRKTSKSRLTHSLLEAEDDWVMMDARETKDSLHFI